MIISLNDVLSCSSSSV